MTAGLGKGKGAVSLIVFPLIKTAEEEMQLGAAPVRLARGNGRSRTTSAIFGNSG